MAHKASRATLVDRVVTSPPACVARAQAPDRKTPAPVGRGRSRRLHATICGLTVPPGHSRSADNGWRMRWVPYRRMYFMSLPVWHGRARGTAIHASVAAAWRAAVPCGHRPESPWRRCGQGQPSPRRLGACPSRTGTALRRGTGSRRSRRSGAARASDPASSRPGRYCRRAGRSVPRCPAVRGPRRAAPTP